MAKIKFTLKGVANEIRKAEKKLRSIRPKVIEADQKKIDLNLRELERSYNLIRIHCPVGEMPIKPFGQWFTSKPK
jgi:hypothetical protein